MSNILTADELVKNLSTRTWYQLGTGAQRYFYGLPGYHFISGATMPVRGAIDAVYAPDPHRPGRYRLISRTIGAPDLPEFSVDFHETWGGLPRHLLNNQCEWTFYELHSRCGDPSDFNRGWEGYVMVYARGLYEGGIDLGTRTARDADDPLTDSATFKAAAIYPAATLSFGEEAAVEVVVEVVDIIYGLTTSCGDCGSDNDGSMHVYALTRANVGSPSAPGQIVYTLDGGATWQTATITGIGATAEPRYLDIAGNILFVGTNATTLFYTTLSSTGAPTTWTSVTLPVAMTDVYVQSPTSIWFTANSGQIYSTIDITVAPTLAATVGTSNYNRIHGTGNVIVATGASGSVAISTNNGATWSAGAAAGSGTNQAIWVTGARTWWIGNAAGELRRTTNQGVSYTSISLPGAPSSILDIVFATSECGWVSTQAASTARLYATIDGGFSFARDDATSRIVSWPTFQRAQRIAAPRSNEAVNANYLAVGGLTTPGTDGLILIGAPSLT